MELIRQDLPWQSSLAFGQNSPNRWQEVRGIKLGSNNHHFLPDSHSQETSHSFETPALCPFPNCLLATSPFRSSAPKFTIGLIPDYDYNSSVNFWIHTPVLANLFPQTEKFIYILFSSQTLYILESTHIPRQGPKYRWYMHNFNFWGHTPQHIKV